MKKIRALVAFGAGVAIAIAAAVYAQSGYPTRPRFLSFGLNANAPTTNGTATINANGTADLMQFQTAAVARGYLRANNNGVGIFSGAGGAGNGFFTGAAGSQIFGLTDINSIAIGDFGRLSQNQTWAGSQTIQGNVTLTSAASPSVATNTTATAAGNYASNLTVVDSGGSPTSTYFFTANNGATAGFGCGSNECGGIWSQAAQAVLTANSNADVLSVSSNALAFDAVDMTPSSGTFTASYTNACTTTPTQSIRWYKIGNLVTMTAAAATATCTGDTTTFDTDATDIPAAIRPSTSNVYSAGFGAQNNGASVTAMIELNGGEIIVNRCGAVTGTCDGGAWTGSGNRSLDAWTLSYVL